MHRRLERVERDARVAADGVRQRLDRLVVDRDAGAAEAVLGVIERAPHDRADRLRLELLEREHARARQQRPDHLERRVLRRRADQRHRAVLDERQDRVLLRLVEAVDLVDEQHGALAQSRAAGRAPPP